MNFQKIPPVKESEYYLQVALTSARDLFKLKGFGNVVSSVNRARRKELIKITEINAKVNNDLMRIVSGFPRYSELSDFYKELFKCYFSIDDYKQDLAKISWIARRVTQFSNIYSKKIKTSTDVDIIKSYSKQFYGRLCSFFKQVDKSFLKLSEYRDSLRSMPDIKEGCYNIALFGFPNAGKSTILSKLTKANPEIASYAFTTKRINLGYTKFRNITLQLMDTPGTLNRFEKMNNIEKQAYLVVRELADVVIFTYDPSESYSLEDQEKLFRRIKEIRKESKNNFEIIEFVTKVDLFEKKISLLKKKNSSLISEIPKLKELLELRTLEFETKLFKEGNKIIDN